MALLRAVVGVEVPLLLYRGVEVAVLRVQRHFIKGTRGGAPVVNAYQCLGTVLMIWAWGVIILRRYGIWTLGSQWEPRDDGNKAS